MKIYFTCSTAEFIKYKKNYLDIRDFLIQENHILTRDWLLAARKFITDNKTDLATNIKKIYDDCIKAINDSEIVIVEDTVSNFSTGHQITVAIQRQKPTLVLWCKPKHKHFNQTFIQGIDSEYLQVSEYNKNNYQDIIKAFIKKYQNASKKTRFHLVVDEVERKYLDWGQFKKHKSRTKLIRESIRKAIDGDQEYQEYLRK
jgi:hypothetical protein